jgi:hypothetical protein
LSEAHALAILEVNGWNDKHREKTVYTSRLELGQAAASGKPIARDFGKNSKLGTANAYVPIIHMPRVVS